MSACGTRAGQSRTCLPTTAPTHRRHSLYGDDRMKRIWLCKSTPARLVDNSTFAFAVRGGFFNGGGTRILSLSTGIVYPARGFDFCGRMGDRRTSCIYAFSDVISLRGSGYDGCCQFSPCSQMAASDQHHVVLFQVFNNPYNQLLIECSISAPLRRGWFDP